MDGGEEVENKKRTGLVVVLGILIAVIIALVIGVVVTFVAHNSGDNNENLIDTSEKMAGWNGPVSASTRATVLTETIEDKLSSDPNYNPEQAVAEYSGIYKEASGELKIYVAIEYAKYIYDTFADLEKAVGIMNEVKDLVNENSEDDYLMALRNLYESAGDNEKATQYQGELEKRMREKGGEPSTKVEE